MLLSGVKSERKLRRKSSSSVGNGQIIMNSHPQQMIPVQINPSHLNYQYEDRDTGQPVIVSADGQQIYVDSSAQVSSVQTLDGKQCF